MTQLLTFTHYANKLDGRVAMIESMPLYEDDSLKSRYVVFSYVKETGFRVLIDSIFMERFEEIDIKKRRDDITSIHCFITNENGRELDAGYAALKLYNDGYRVSHRR